VVSTITSWIIVSSGGCWGRRKDSAVFRQQHHEQAGQHEQQRSRLPRLKTKSADIVVSESDR
jgi:hypothetical protein